MSELKTGGIFNWKSSWDVGNNEAPRRHGSSGEGQRGISLTEPPPGCT